MPKFNIPNGYDDTPAVTIIDDTITFVSVKTDTDCSDPTKSMEGIGSIRSFNTRHYNFIEPDVADGLMKKDKDIVKLSYFEHGLAKWFVQPASKPTDMYFQFDGVYTAGIWVPDDIVRDSYMGQDGLSRRDWMIKQAESACEIYTSWVNGDCFGYEIEQFKLRRDDDGEPYADLNDYRRDKNTFEDSCWGFYGVEEVLEAVKDALPQS